MKLSFIKKIFCISILVLAGTHAFSQETKAKDVALKAASKENADESIEYLKSTVKSMNIPAEKRAVYVLLGTIQEQMSYYSDAVVSFASAAGIAATDADGMPKKTNEELVIDAVRCALSAGDYHTADNYLNSAVRNSKSDVIQSYIKLYSQWSALCRADTPEEIQEPVVMLQAYTKVQSMSSVWPSIYLTLWYITGEESYADIINKQFPSSIESAIVKGDVQILPSPFWFFVPKSGEAEPETGSYSPSAYETVSAELPAADVPSGDEKKAGRKKLQLGLFRTESNAKLLVDELKQKGFTCYVTSEKRASGTTYYIVLTEENDKNTVADELRSAGYDCYVVD